MTLKHHLSERLAQRRAQHLYRHRRCISSAQGARVRVDGRQLINFCSNDYLGLANHPQVKEAAQKALDEYGVGSGASHLVCGHSDLHHQLEVELAEFTGRSRALLFSTGYMANMGVMAALLSRTDQVLEDRLNHASLLDGGLLSGAQLQRFRHNNLDDLTRRLQRPCDGQRLLAVDGVYSMDGDIAPLPELAQLAAQSGAWLMVDDAHGLGVLGSRGAGTCEHFEMSEEQVPILMGTLGKSIGSFGAFIAGSDELIEALVQFARTYIYTTALPPAVAAASLASLRLLRSDSGLPQRLQLRVKQFRELLPGLGLQVGESSTAIQPLLLGDDQRALAWSECLFEQGLWVSAIRPPTVPKGTARLRITLSAAHTAADIAQLIDGLEMCRKKVG